MTRSCENCDADIVCAPQPVTDAAAREQRFEEIYAAVEELLAVDGTIDSFAFAVLSSFRADFRRLARSSPAGILDAYPALLRDVRDCVARRNDADAALAHISSMLISLEQRPEQWKELQFMHLKQFPQAVCTSCSQSVCISCGFSPFHSGQTCTECIADMVARSASDAASSETLASLEWKMRNSKRCPNCSVLINRDEGCNKVDCLFCGHKFCWQCLGQFEKGGCGFYRCQLVGVVEETVSAKRADDTPEIGVPNVISVQAKWQRAPMVEA
nr:hypothetical protein HK105_004692 [Polyrhizophydium stewartii]